jgi:hypothetical protein
MHDPFDRKIGFVGVALVKGRVKNGIKSRKGIEIQLDNVIRVNTIFNGAPFLSVLLVYRYGIKNDFKLEFKRINKKYGDLDVALELDMQILQWADQSNLDLLHDIFMIAALEALLQVCDKYKLPKEVIVEERLKYGNIPNTIKECEMYGK